jgi:hypothetical protein
MQTFMAKLLHNETKRHESILNEYKVSADRIFLLGTFVSREKKFRQAYISWQSIFNRISVSLYLNKGETLTKDILPKLEELGVDLSKIEINTQNTYVEFLWHGKPTVDFTIYIEKSGKCRTIEKKIIKEVSEYIVICDE